MTTLEFTMIIWVQKILKNIYEKFYKSQITTELLYYAKQNVKGCIKESQVEEQKGADTNAGYTVQSVWFGL